MTKPASNDSNTALVESPKENAILKRGINEAQWKTLTQSLYPGANINSVLMVWDYCKARQLDPLKKPCHIVPMKVKNAQTNQYEWRDVVMPGIYEYRTTAQRTGHYLGHSKPEYGDFEEQFGVDAPVWCAMTMYRWNAAANQRVEFPVCVYFDEVVALKDGRANDRWAKAPVQMLTKCTEAAGLREAFPDEFGGEATAEEMEGRTIGTADTPETPKLQLPMPDGYEHWLIDLTATTDEGLAAFETAWKASKQEYRVYLAATEPERLDALSARATQADERA